MDELCQLANDNGLVIIEDCAHAIETEYRGKKAGVIGDFGCFSFYVTKNLVTGEGGMVVCKQDASRARLQMLALHGLSQNGYVSDSLQ